ncbi:MAG TPA: urea ABC transporter ATP-binding subunit UrtE [Polyangiales bacterium]|jgi:urea transport system ATP-binding protein|nr:urea ABC transporter ATP-binding subunit UrtE [Polyangiales bacterium]
MLQVEGLNQYYGQSHTLWDVTFDVKEGSCMCVMGRNGVGKTTLMRVVMGLLKAKSGSVKFDGKELVGRAPEARPRVGIAYVPQGREIFAQLSVEDNLKVGLVPGGKKTIPDSVFKWFPVLKEMMHRRGGDLSGGQQQQLALGRALTLEPKLLILDEPTEGIQPNIVQQIGDTVKRLREEAGITVLLVEQKLGFARKMADQFTILDRGRTVAAGQMTDLDDTLVQRYLAV